MKRLTALIIVMAATLTGCTQDTPHDRDEIQATTIEAWQMLGCLDPLRDVRSCNLDSRPELQEYCDKLLTPDLAGDLAVCTLRDADGRYPPQTNPDQRGWYASGSGFFTVADITIEGTIAIADATYRTDQPKQIRFLLAKSDHWRIFDWCNPQFQPGVLKACEEES